MVVTKTTGRFLGGWLVVKVLLLAFPIGISSVSAHASTSPQVQALLSKMSRSAHTLNYQGRFTYEHGSALESFKVLHWVHEGVEYEHLQYLSGPEREIVRQGRPVDCASPGDQLLMGRIALSDGDTGRLEQHYQLDIQGEERVAGRPAMVLRIIPRDRYRYGYLLSVDRDTGLLLKSLLIDENNHVLERFQFVSLELDPDLSAAGARPEAKWRRVANPHLSECNQSQPGEPSEWRLAWVPPGFIFSGQQRVHERIDMLMYTDGLSSFSVFLEPVSGQTLIEGRAQRGATNAFMGRVARRGQEYRITVIGEIPSGAAEQVAVGLEGRSGN